MRLLNVALLLGLVAVSMAYSGYPLSNLLPQKELHRAALHNFVDVIAENKDAIKHGINHHLDNGDDDDGDNLDISPHFPNAKPHLNLMEIIDHSQNNQFNENSRSWLTSIFKFLGKKAASSAGKGIANKVYGGEQNRFLTGFLKNPKLLKKLLGGKSLIQAMKEQHKKLQRQQTYQNYPEQQRFIDWFF